MTNEQFIKVIDRERRKIEKRGERSAFNVLKKQYSIVARFFRASSDPLRDYEKIGSLFTDTLWTEWYLDYYPLSANIGNIQRKELTARKSVLADLLRKDAEDDFYVNEYESSLRLYAQRIAGERVTGLNGTTRDTIVNAIRRSVDDGAFDGLGVDKVRDSMITILNNSISRGRAQTIAQTEMMSASNYAQDRGARSTGIAFGKTWSDSGLDNVRESHKFANDQSAINGPIGMDAKFNMGNGVWMLYPSDPTAPAEEVINCRCTCIYDPL